MTEKINKASTISNKKTTPKTIPQKSVTPRQKSLTLKQVEKNYKNLSKWSTYVLDPETNLVLKYKEKFDQEEVDKLLIEAHQTLVYVEENPDLDIFDDDTFTKYLHILMIKYFTNLGKDFPDTFEGQIPVMSQLIATGLFSVIFEHVFDPNEVLSVLDKFNKIAGLVEKIGSLTEEAQKEVLDNLNNPEIISGAFNDKI